MNQESYELFKRADIQTILSVLENELKTRNESPFWSDKVIPFSESILSILIPLREANMLFSPEGKAIDELTPELFFAPPAVLLPIRVCFSDAPPPTGPAIPYLVLSDTPPSPEPMAPLDEAKPAPE